MRRLVVLAALCAIGCSSPPKSGSDSGIDEDGCEALKVGVAMACATTCGSSPGPDASFPDPDTDAGGPSSDPIFFDAGSNAPPPPDFGRPIADLGQPDFGPPIDFGTPPDMGIGHDGGWPPADTGFEYGSACELTLNDDGTISEWHGDNEEGGTWSCSDGVVRIDNTERGRQSYVLGADGCLQGPDYNYN